MEGAQEAAPQPPAPAGPKKNNNMIIIAVVVVAIIVIAIAAAVMMGGSDDDDNNGTGDDNGNDLVAWEPEVGDFYEYTVSAMGFTGTMRTEVVAVSTTTMTVNVSTTYMGQSSSYEEDVPLGTTYYSMDDIAIDNPPAGTTVVDKGSQVLNLDIGTITTHHYKVTVTEDGQETSFDAWIYKDMLVKLSGNMSGTSMTVEMTDTNIF